METCWTIQPIKRSNRYRKRRTQTNRLRGRRGWGSGAIVPGGGESRRIGSEGAAYEVGGHFGCSGVILGRLEVQGLGKGPPGVLTGGAVEWSVLSCLNILLAPRAKPWVWAVPIGVAQEVGGS